MHFYEILYNNIKQETSLSKLHRQCI